MVDVTGWGGKLRSYEVVVDNDRLLAHGATISEVLSAIGKSDGNVGGQTVNFGPQAAIVRGIGLIQATDQIQNVLITSNNGTPVLLKDVASVGIGNEPRLGIAGEGQDDDIVMGIVLMQRGAQSMPAIAAVKQEVDTINSTGVLPPGVRLERIYDRSDLISLTTRYGDAQPDRGCAAHLLPAMGCSWAICAARSSLPSPFRSRSPLRC